MVRDRLRVPHGPSAGFTLVEVMVALALIALITIVFIERSAAYGHAARVTQVVRDIEALSAAAWQIRRSLPYPPGQDGGKVIDAAFAHDPRTKTAVDSYKHALGDTLRVAYATNSVTIQLFGLSVSDCTALLQEIDVQDFMRVFKGAYILKNNQIPPYGGEISGGVTAIQNACSGSAVTDPLNLQRVIIP